MKENNIVITGQRIGVVRGIRGLVRNKIRRLIRHNKHITRVKINLIRNKNYKHKEEYTVRDRIDLKRATLVASADSDGVRKSLGKLIGRLDRKIRRRARIKTTERKNMSGRMSF